ncbi:MAG: DUF397 domain-containing protein [Nanoarchaeota archaeon]|nr:DUF397 domain-containing protein [Nanoarchaeota archaeon]
MKVQADDKKQLRKIKFKDGDFHKASGTLMRRICVMVAHKNGAIAVRDSKDASKKTLIFNEKEWGVFTKGVKAGEFDL